MSGEGTFGFTAPGEKPHWRDEPATEKQKVAIFNMASALRFDYVEPTTKGEAADLIELLSLKMNEPRDPSDYPDDRPWDDD